MTFPIFLRERTKGIIGEKLPTTTKTTSFNVVCKLLTTLQIGYTDEEAANMYNQVSGYELDTMLFKALNEQHLKINVQVTYSDALIPRADFRR